MLALHSFRPSPDFRIDESNVEAFKGSRGKCKIAFRWEFLSCLGRDKELSQDRKVMARFSHGSNSVKFVRHCKRATKLCRADGRFESIESRSSSGLRERAVHLSPDGNRAECGRNADCRTG